MYLQIGSKNDKFCQGIVNTRIVWDNIFTVGAKNEKNR